MLQLAGLALLVLGALLLAADLSFIGLDLLCGLLFVGALLIGVLNTLRRYSLFWGLLTTALAALALSAHVALRCGWV